MSIQTVHAGALEYLAAGNIPVPHGFTTRLGGVSTGDFGAMNLAVRPGEAPENVRKNHEILASALGFDPDMLVLTHQTHSDRVRQVTAADCLGADHHAYPPCDGLITDTDGLALMIFTADCTPILLYDPVTGAVGAAHAGWRGTAEDIAGKTAAAMAESFGSRPADLCAAIGPNIGECCFQTDGDVPQAMRAAFGQEAEKWIRPDGEKYYVNLKALNALALRRAGVVNIQISTACTACQPARFWSHRVHGASRGSQGAVIICRRGKA